MSAEGIEPSTNGLKGRCSAIELRARVSESEGHSNMGDIQRQRKMQFYREAREDRQEEQFKNLCVLSGLRG